MFSLTGAHSSASDGPDATPSLEDAHEAAGNAAGWIEENWTDWLAGGLRIIVIAVVAVLLRYVIRRAISKLITRMNRRAVAAASGNALRGLIVNNERRRQRSAAIGSVLRSTASFVIMGTAVLMVLSGLGINPAPLLASAGVAGVALGFGARNLVTDLLAGVFMLLEDQYGVGDRVDVGEATGTVLEIGLRITQLRGDDGEIWYIRNGEIKRVGNLSQGWGTAALDVQVRADEDLDEVRAAVTSAAEELGGSRPWDEHLWEPVQVLGLDSVTLDSMVVRVSAKTMPGKELGVARELRWRIKKALDARGIPLVDDASLAAARASAPLPAPASGGGGDAGPGQGGEGGGQSASGAGAGTSSGAPSGGGQAQGGEGAVTLRK